VSAVPFTAAREMGMIACHHCGTVWRDVSDGERCGRCRARLHSRKPDSLNRTWALLLTAGMLYLPANLLPVMTTRSLLGTQEDTILSGVIYFWVSGDPALAAIVFIASFLVPLFKLAALMLMAIAARRQSAWARAERTRLYRIVEVIGRWSMLDVFVVALLAGLVRMDQIAEITAGPGIASFGGVVVLTMLASICFDPRLAWDAPQPAHALNAGSPGNAPIAAGTARAAGSSPLSGAAGG
jgi:paraquat-inducible protein A